ncbi:7-cyano-7-deazaguanine synthase [Campylobacter sp. faydin G-140]|uniref:7-cyano-7-deazaguanine synthase n=1 Tax=Campylobacter anatolicus TaxID=2829105 RepID=UPI001B94649C|nr:7-cyano-7-deazaguanine synthase [Campylobacter anatolicus]MBR8465669.1 7-cyano-7-deazaguanine synthase [Campylobacter anatolicus]
MKKAVCIMSGGMDSTLCATIAKHEGYEIVALHFDYNQRTMRREKVAFEQICDRLGITTKLNLDVSFIADIGGSSLTDMSIQVPKNGESLSELKNSNIKNDRENLSDTKNSNVQKDSQDVPNTYVPFRNGIFVSIATALAEKHGASAIFIGVVEEDGSGYPDCTASFISKINNAINVGTAKNTNIEIITPLINLNKSQIVARSLELGSPLELTWSCYENDDEACGMCDSCRLRLRGFKMANTQDPIRYKI